MNSLLIVFILVPLVGYLVSLLLPPRAETLLSQEAFLTTGLQVLLATGFVGLWLVGGHQVLDMPSLYLFSNRHYTFQLDFYFDTITAVYLLVGSILCFLVTVYSRYYLHREGGYKRFFNTVLFFFLGYNVVIFSGNFETMFIGWEILGISSFLLIAFYRNRYLPVKNAVKVFSIYRIGDVGLLLAMWLSHHLFHQNITFRQLNTYSLVSEHLQQHSGIGIFISLLILLSAAAKSAQLPFSSWLPRAMEGPTPSSAIFYGSLSVHIGAFLLLRTYTFWEHQPTVRLVIIGLGLATTLVASGIARVQSSIKSQIAYASIAQIGLIFVEIALGFEKLALFHFAGNAFLRTYQLLVSPSVVSYLIREQFYHFSPEKNHLERRYPSRLLYTAYVLCLKEWNLDSLLYRYLWNPLKWFGRQLNFLSLRRVIWFSVPPYLVGLYCVYHRELLPQLWQHYLPVLFGFIGLLMVLKAFTERVHARLSWVIIMLNHCWTALSIAFNERFSFNEVHLYLSGIFAFGLLGYVCLMRLKRLGETVNLSQFHGHAYEHPKIALLFLLACLGLTGFPISPTFIGEDLIFSHIHENQWLLAGFVALSFVLDGLATIRIYARVFLGPHNKTYHEIAYRSS